MADIRPNAVALYIRWSTDEQTEGTTLETQRERCSLYVRSQGWAVNPDLIFVDDGFSGGSLDRPALARLRQLISAGQVDCVVTYSMDRLSRSVADTVQLVQQEWLGKCIYRSASQPISTEDGNPTGQLIFNILASFAEFERALIRERTHSGLVRRARQGMYPGTQVAPFGYRRDGKGRLVSDALGPDGALRGPAALVRRIFELAATGAGPTLIARALAGDGIASPRGGKWWAQQIRTILKNPVYCGDLVYGRRRINPAHRRDRAAPQRLYDQKPLAVVKDAVPAIVDRALWEKAQQLFASRAAGAARRSIQSQNRSLLAAIARCRCGGPLSVFYDRCKRRYYRCSRNFLSAGGCPCRPGVLPAEAVEAVVADAVRVRYGTPELLAGALAEAATLRNESDRVDGIAKAIAAADRRLQEIAGELARLRRSARQGEISFATFAELKADAEAERAQLLERKAELSARLAQPAAPDGAGDVWAALDVPARREILSGLLRTIVIFKPKGSDQPPEVELVWEAPSAR